MKIFLTTFIILINIFSICMSYKMLNEMTAKRKILIVSIAEILMLLILNIIYEIAAKNIMESVSSISKNLLIFSFLPANLIVMFSPIAKQLNKMQLNEITRSKLSKKLTVYIIIDAIILIIECIYIKNIELGIIKIMQNSKNLIK